MFQLASKFGEQSIFINLERKYISVYISATEWKLVLAQQGFSLSGLQPFADIETCFVGGGRVLQGGRKGDGRLDVYYDNPVSVKMV